MRTYLAALNAEQRHAVQHGVAENGAGGRYSDGKLAVATRRGSESTCQVYVEAEWLSRLPSPEDDEVAILEVAEEVKPESRLACQIRLTAELDGLEVTLAPGSW